METAISRASRETAVRNVLVWFLCSVGSLRFSPKVNRFTANVGINARHTGSFMPKGGRFANDVIAMDAA